MTIRRIIAAVSAALVVASLSACGNDKAARENPFALALTSIRDRSAPKADPASQLTREAIDQIEVPLILAVLETRDVSGALVQIGDNGGDETWASSYQVAVILRDGVLRGTRGFGEDMMSADVPSLRQLRTDGSATRRSYYHLDGNDQTRTDEFACRVQYSGAESLEVVGRTFATRRYAEVCRNDREQFTNEYWFKNSGKIVQSRQWVSPSVGFLRLTWVNP